MTALMGAKFLGMRQIIAVDIVPWKLELAKELGATDILDSTQTKDIVADIKTLTRGGAGYSVDCTGVPRVIEQSIECLASSGVAAMVGVPAPGLKGAIDLNKFLVGNKVLKGVIDGGSNPPEVSDIDPLC
jgi:Zn-dependent alcohol dehydrogenase